MVQIARESRVLPDVVTGDGSVAIEVAAPIAAFEGGGVAQDVHDDPRRAGVELEVADLRGAAVAVAPTRERDALQQSDRRVGAGLRLSPRIGGAEAGNDGVE
ncbi:hypothetical protein GCM10023217_05380 [Gordonia alkaliphila]|uniref:Uncharacterized protein n=1 Tax=Gordonia alkaliphila TaxID=1053547 RepID=A0ABP8YUZ2_9ACTN